MNDVLDSPEYKWVLAPARELHVALSEIYPTPKAAMFIAKQAGFKEATLNPDQEASLLWMNILDKGATQARNRKLVTLVVEQNSTSPRRAFFEALLSDQIAVPTDAQP